MEQLTYFGQIVLAAVLGAILGFQRERWGKPAGPRTYALVAAGAALFTVLSVHAFQLSESSRVASNVVIGIGFLGAGLIFQREAHVENLTTAAGLWAAAGMGMAVGVGYYWLAGGATLLMLALLMIDDSRFKKKQDE